MRTLYNQVEQILERVNFEQLWPGFSKADFALYNQENVYLPNNEFIEYDNRFIGNTRIDYNGRNIAIWYVEDPTDEDSKLLASNMVHEMFHAFQANQNESRFSNDLKGLNYPSDVMYFQMKQNESLVLVQALEENDNFHKEQLFLEFIRLRQKRSDIYSNYVGYEFAIETVEGCAEYCGTQALMQISEEQYYERLTKYKKIITEDYKMLFDIRRYSYFMGTLVLLLANQLKLEVNREINGNNATIFEDLLHHIMDENKLVVSEAVNELVSKSATIDKTVQENYHQLIKEKEDLFQQFFAKKPGKQEGKYNICGYDPMNMIKQENQILHKHFVMLSNEIGETNFIKGPIVTELELGSSNAVVAYYSN